MDNIKDYLKNMKLEPYNPEKEIEALKEKVEYEKNIVGDYDKVDGYDCKICKNKGYVPKLITEGFPRIVDVKCDCMNIRKSLRSLQNCGLGAETLKNSTFKNYKQEYGWQKDLVSKVAEFLKDYDKNYWFYLGGETGSGKTMLMTALFKKLILEKHLTGYYVLWNNEAKQLITLSKRDSEKYSERMYELNTCDILYIDDFLKLENQYLNEGISLAYEVINNRYVNNKITIISSELIRTQLEATDRAIYGRVFEKTNGGKYFINIIGQDKNYRLKKGSEDISTK